MTWPGRRESTRAEADADSGGAAHALPAQLRVAVVLDAAPPWSVGGRERRYAELFTRWAASDLDLTVYTMRWWDEPPSGRPAYRAIIPRVPLYARGRRSILHAILFSFGTLQLIVRPLDVVLADHMPYLQLFPLRLITWLRRVPLVVDWHEYWGPEYWHEYLGRAGALAAAIEATATRMPDEIVLVSPQLRAALRAHGAPDDRLVVISNAVDRAHAVEVPAAPEAPDLLFVGRLIDHKRCDLAIEALAALQPAVRLGIVGVGPEREHLEQLAVQLGVATRVTFFGSLERHDDVWSLIRGARVFVSPSLREGFGIAVAEALAVGTPVVTVDDPNNDARLLVDEGETGAIVAVGSGQMADAISRWLDAPRSRDQVAAAFWSRHADLDWDVSARRYQTLLRDAAASAARHRSLRRGDAAPSSS